jgi:hypothetical protein
MIFTGHAPKHLLCARGKFVSEFARDAAVGGDNGVSSWANLRARGGDGFSAKILLQPTSLPLARKPFVFNALMPPPK